MPSIWVPLIFLHDTSVSGWCSRFTIYCRGPICQHYSHRCPKAPLSRSPKAHRLVLLTSQTGVATASTSLIQGVQYSIIRLSWASACTNCRKWSSCDIWRTAAPARPFFRYRRKIISYTNPSNTSRFILGRYHSDSGITIGMEASFPKLAMAAFGLVTSLDFPLALVGSGVGSVTQMFHLLALWGPLWCASKILW